MKPRRDCPDCDGTGHDGNGDDCPRCSGEVLDAPEWQQGDEGFGSFDDG